MDGVWRPARICIGCKVSVAHNFQADPEYAWDYCIDCMPESSLPSCKGCNMYTDFQRELCRYCSKESDQNCINSCCVFGKSVFKLDVEKLRNWYAVWKHYPPAVGIPRDVFRVIALHFRYEARECYFCGPGKWHQKFLLIKNGADIYVCPDHESWCLWDVRNYHAKSFCFHGVFH
jgi:hypothetical protein